MNGTNETTEPRFINIPQNLHQEFQSLFVLLSKAINTETQQNPNINNTSIEPPIQMENIISEINKILAKQNLPLISGTRTYIPTGNMNNPKNSM